MIRACIAALALLTVTSAARADDGCAKDTDCKGSRICVDHACVDAPKVQGCNRDLDCAGDDICEGHICVPPANGAAPATPPPPKKTKKDLIREAAEKAAADKAAREEARKEAQRQAAEKAAAEKAAREQARKDAAEKAAAEKAAREQAKKDAADKAAADRAAREQAKKDAIEKAKAEKAAKDNPQPATSVEVTPPPPPPALIQAQPEPAKTEVKSEALPPAPAASTAPTPPPELIAAPPPPLVAAPAQPAPPHDDHSDSPGLILYGVGLTAGIHTISSTASETDFGLDLNLDVGIRVASVLGLEVFAQGGWQPMLSSGTAEAPVSHAAFLGGIGLGVRLDHLGPIPGDFLLGGMGSFGTITSSDSTPAISLSGGGILLQYGLPVIGPLEARGQASVQFMNDGFTVFTLTAGIAFGD